MRPTSTLPFALAAVATMAACRSPDPVPAETGPVSTVVAPVTILAEELSYAPGSEVRIRISNFTQDTLGYNPCTRVVERHASGNSWNQVDESGRMCTMQLHLIEPRMTRIETTSLPAGIAGGTYRLTIMFSPQKATPSGRTPGLRASTQPFIIR